MTTTIGGWLSNSEGQAFAAYAAEIGIDSAALATILINREIQCANLPNLVGAGEKGQVHKGKRITARTKRTELKSLFATHAAKHGLSSDAAAATVFRAELNEKWLEKCLAKRGNQVDSDEE